MLVELGPVAAETVQAWTRFARRMVTEIRVDPGDLGGDDLEDLLGVWSRFIDEWGALAGEAGTQTFRWSNPIEVEMAEFLLHGIERCLQSATVRARITDDEAQLHRPFTLHVIRAFVDAIEAEGVAHEHYADQLRDQLGSSID